MCYVPENFIIRNDWKVNSLKKVHKTYAKEENTTNDVKTGTVKNREKPSSKGR